METVEIESGFEAWREAARALLARGLAPTQVIWRGPGQGQASLLAAMNGQASVGDPALAVSSPYVSRAFLGCARKVVYHVAEDRNALLYRLLWRINHGERGLMDRRTDEDVARLVLLEKQIRRDAHKMKAFVRFQKISQADQPEEYLAWHRPDHDTLPLVADFFADRFKAMRWTILTPQRSVRWDGELLQWGPGCTREQAGDEDALVELWRTYYRSIFNPARIKLKAMRAEMPQRYWPTMPETQIISELLREAPERLSVMLENQRETARVYVPEGEPGLDVLREAIEHCAACDLCTQASGAVFGEGPVEARLAIIGEQPGDHEDRAGEPFVGPAGQILRGALVEAGLDIGELYVTNAVKAFKHELVPGKGRIHKRPEPGEVAICKPWLRAQLQALRPRVIVALGSTAALALMGRRVAIKRERGRHDSALAEHLVVSYHPASVLRLPEEHRPARLEALIEDLRLARDLG